MGTFDESGTLNVTVWRSTPLNIAACSEERSRPKLRAATSAKFVCSFKRAQRADGKCRKNLPVERLELVQLSLENDADGTKTAE